MNEAHFDWNLQDQGVCGSSGAQCAADYACETGQLITIRSIDLTLP